MRRLLISVAILSLVTGCSIFGGKKDVASNPDLIQDASSNKDPVKMKDPKIFDGGKYNAGEDIGDIKMHGGDAGRTIPVEKYYSVDRETNAPLNKMLYVLTDENPARCLMAKFTTVDNHKRLVVFSKSAVPSNFCVYQKSFSSSGHGFSIWAIDGGVCRPSATTIVTDKERKIASVQDTLSNNVSFRYCADNTRSFGEELSHGNMSWGTKKTKTSTSAHDDELPSKKIQD